MSVAHALAPLLSGLTSVTGVQQDGLGLQVVLPNIDLESSSKGTMYGLEHVEQGWEEILKYKYRVFYEYDGPGKVLGRENSVIPVVFTSRVSERMQKLKK